MTKQLVHYGKILDSNINELKCSKVFVMDILKIKSYETLQARIEDGAFSYDQLRALKQFNLI